MKPFLSASSPAEAIIQQTYPGGKGNCYQQIINQIPPHTTYIEPFMGYGAVLRAKSLAPLSIGIDKDINVVHRVAASFRQSSLRAAIAAPIVTTNVTAVPLHMTMAANIDIDEDASVWLMHGDSLPFLATVPLTGDEFIYVDPPYLFSTRASKRQLYNHEFGSEEQHIDLLNVLNDLNCPVAISGYFSELYADMLAEWRTHTFTAVTRGGTVATEWLWLNFPKPRKLHEYTYLGDNFRERERIKRKASRWVIRFTALPDLEREAIIDHLHGAGIAIHDGGRGNG